MLGRTVMALRERVEPVPATPQPEIEITKMLMRVVLTGGTDRVRAAAAKELKEKHGLVIIKTESVINEAVENGKEIMIAVNNNTWKLRENPKVAPPHPEGPLAPTPPSEPQC